MPGVTTTDRPSPILLDKTGIDRASAACVIREFPDRSLDVSANANSAPPDDPLPDNLWFIRSADCTPATRTQPRSGESQSAVEGTVFFLGTDELAAFEGPNEFVEDFQSEPLGLHSSDVDPFTEPRVILWMRAGESALRAVSINGTQTRSTIEPEQIEPARELSLQENEVSHACCQQTVLDTPSALLVWTLWTNPLCQ